MAGIGSLGLGAKFGFAFKLIALVYFFAVILIGVANGIYVYSTTGDWHPLVEETAGRVFGADYKIYGAMEELKKEDLPRIYRDNFKEDIVESLLFLFVFGWIIYWILMRFLGIAGRHLGMEILFIFITIAILFAMEVLYLRIVTGSNHWGFIGLWNLITNFKYVLMSGGSVVEEVIKTTANNTIANTTL